MNIDEGDLHEDKVIRVPLVMSHSTVLKVKSFDRLVNYKSLQEFSKRVISSFIEIA